MNFIDAVGDWKSNDEWRYADKEAAWKFFFAAGKESSQAVISAQCVKMSQYESIIFELRAQLAAEQLNNKRLRQDQELLIEAWNYGQFADDFNQPQASSVRAAIRRFCEALSTPISTEALDKYVAEKVKDESRIAELEAENARLKTVPMKYRRMQFNAQLQDENNELRNQLAKAEQRVTEAICELLESQHTWLTKEAVSALIRRKFVKEV